METLEINGKDKSVEIIEDGVSTIYPASFYAVSQGEKMLIIQSNNPSTQKIIVDDVSKLTVDGATFTQATDAAEAINELANFKLGGASSENNGGNITLPIEISDVSGLTSELNNIDSALNLKENKENKGVANGYASLDSSEKILVSELPDFIVSGMIYGGVFDPTTGIAVLTHNAQNKLGTSLNSIVLTNDTNSVTGFEANEGIFYISTSVGELFGSTFTSGDWIVSTGYNWIGVSNTETVVSVNGQLGMVELTAADVDATPAINYSTAEQNTGIKWIDDSDIYQQTFQLNTGTTVNAFVAMYTIPNFRQLVKLEGYMLNPTGSSIPSGFYNAGTTFALSVNNIGVIQNIHATTSFNNCDVICTVYYTKN